MDSQCISRLVNDYDEGCSDLLARNTPFSGSIQIIDRDAFVCSQEEKQKLKTRRVYGLFVYAFPSFVPNNKSTAREIFVKEVIVILEVAARRETMYERVSL